MRQLARTMLTDFALDSSKLQRIVSILQDALKGSDYEVAFSADLKNTKQILTSDLQELLASDNTVANPIQHLRVFAGTQDRLKHVSVHFQAGTDRYMAAASVTIRCDDSAWSSALYSALEEQVERTALRDLVSRYSRSRTARKLLSPLLALFVAAFAVLFTVGTIGRLAGSSQEARELIERAKTVQTQEEKIDFLLRKAQHDLHRLDRSQPDAIFGLITLPVIVAAAPFVIVVLLVGYCLTRCYPGSVFLWGDYAEYHARVLARRAMIWNVVLVALVVGLVINLSSTVLGRALGL